MSLGATEFEERYNEKGKRVLDNIFGEFSLERDRVKLTRPRREHEVVMVVDYEQPDQLKKIISSLCKWLSEDNGFDSLEDLMLY